MSGATNGEKNIQARGKMLTPGISIESRVVEISIAKDQK